jgi:hypothetical protein
VAIFDPLPTIFDGMISEGCGLHLELTREEALAIFIRCLNSSEADSPDIVSALRKLGRLLESDSAELLAS